MTLFKLSKVEPVFHKYWYGPFPGLIATPKVPELSPAHKIVSVCVMLISSKFTVTFTESYQVLLPSEIATQYCVSTEGLTLMVDEVSPVDHR